MTLWLALCGLPLLGCMPGGPQVPSRDEAMKAGVGACQPIVKALSRFREAKGRYPDRLDELVAAKFIDAIPETPEFGESKRRGVTYQVSQPLDIYRLCFSYEVADGLFGAIVLWSYLPDADEWEGSKYPSSFWDETAERAALRFRERRDAKSLRVFVETVSRGPNFAYFYENRVVKWLGEGREVTVPPPHSPDGKKGFVYGVGGSMARYCFTYRPHLLTMLDGEKQDFPVVDKLYSIETVGGEERWNLLLDNQAKKRR